MKSVIRVETHHGVIQFANDATGNAAARSYAKKWGGKILNATNEIGEQPIPPVGSPGVCSLMGLSPIAISTNDGKEFEAAWTATQGRNCSLQDREKISAALISYWRAAGGFSYDAAEAFVRSRHPVLFSSSSLPTASNEGWLGANEAVLAIGPTVTFS